MKNRPLLYFLVSFLLTNLVLSAQVHVPYKDKNSWSFMNRHTKKIVLEGFEEAHYFKGAYALVKKNNLWGALDTSLKVAIPIKYNKIEYLSENLIKATSKELMYLYSSKIKFNSGYKDIAFLKNSDSLIVTADEHGKYGIIHKNGKTLIPNEFDGPPKEVIPGVLILPKQNKSSFFSPKKQTITYGALNLKGEVLLPFKYTFIYAYGSDKLRAENEDESILYMLDGTKVEIPKASRFLRTTFFTEIHINGNTIEVYPNEKSKPVIFQQTRYYKDVVFGLDTSGTMQILSKEGELTKLSEGLRPLFAKNDAIKFCQINNDQRCTSYGLLNLAGEEILPANYANIVDWNQQYVVCASKQYEGYHALIKLADGDTLLPYTYNYIKLMNCNFIKAATDSSIEYFDASLSKIKPIEVADIIPGVTYITVEQSFTEKVEEQLNRNYPDDNHQIMSSCDSLSYSPIKINDLTLISNKYRKAPLKNLFKVSVSTKTGKWQNFVISNQGLVLSELEYTAILSYLDEYILVAKSDTIGTGFKQQYGAIDFKGNLVIATQFDEIVQILPHHIMVKKHGVFGVISKKGELVIPITYNGISYNEKGYFLLEKFSKWEIADMEGTILSSKYDKILEVYNNGIFKVRKAEKEFYIDEDGYEYVSK